MIHFVPPLSLFKRQNEQNDSFRTPSVTLQETKRIKMNEMIHFVPPLSLYKRQNDQNEQNNSFCTLSVTLQETK
jgi:hypothetical protein